MMGDDHCTRRDALTRIGAVVGSFGFLGSATAQPDDETLRVNVGWARPSGRRAARRKAEKVYYVFSFDALTIEISAAGIQELRQRDDIRYVEPDSKMEALDQTLPWGIDRVDADVAHENGENGGADIAILDTGIERVHPDLEENLGEGTAFQAGVQSNLWGDRNGHGTHVAGIAGAINNSQGVVGISPGTTLHSVKVLTAAGVGFTSDVARGIEWTAEQGYDVGNLSLGGGKSQMLQDACQFAVNHGVFLSAAAGNAGCKGCVTYPAAYQSCVAVSATTKNDGLADFSSYGEQVELAAPGTDIYSTYLGGTYQNKSGTSMSCPHVSGAAGQLMANGSSNSEARAELKDTAEDIGLSEPKTGAGLLDVAAALGLDSSEDLGGGSADDEPVPVDTSENGSAGGGEDGSLPVSTPDNGSTGGGDESTLPGGTVD